MIVNLLCNSVQIDSSLADDICSIFHSVDVNCSECICHIVYGFKLHCLILYWVQSKIFDLSIELDGPHSQQSDD
jgi:hypothetical protein